MKAIYFLVWDNGIDPVTFVMNSSGGEMTFTGKDEALKYKYQLQAKNWQDDLGDMVVARKVLVTKHKV